MAKRGAEHRDYWNIGMITVGVMALLFAGYAFFASATRSAPDYVSTYVPPVVALDKSGTIALVGDSYFNGSNGVPKGSTFGDVAAQAVGWEYKVFGAGGIGYATQSEGGARPLGSFEDQVVASQPRVVVLEGGLNDARSGKTPAEVGDAAKALFTSMKARLPAAKIIVIGPFTTPQTAETSAALSGAVRDAAQSANVTFIDPIADNWLADPAWVDPDGIHLTPEGVQQYAARLQPALA